MKRYPLAAGVTALFIMLVACSPAAPSPSAPSGGIVISDFKYTGTLTVKTGQQVTVTNDDPTDHTLTDQATLAAAGQTLAGQTPTGSTPTGSTPTGSTPTGSTPTGSTPTGSTPTGQKAAQFSTGTIEPSGGTRSFTAPAEPGSYQFGCRVHPTMQGILTVQG